jgi:hypothetical protein
MASSPQPTLDRLETPCWVYRGRSFDSFLPPLPAAALSAVFFPYLLEELLDAAAPDTDLICLEPVVLELDAAELETTDPAREETPTFVGTDGFRGADEVGGLYLLPAMEAIQRPRQHTAL